MMLVMVTIDVCHDEVIVSLVMSFYPYASYCFVFFFQAEDGIRDAQESRGLGDVYKRQE